MVIYNQILITAKQQRPLVGTMCLYVCGWDFTFRRPCPGFRL